MVNGCGSYKRWRCSVLGDLPHLYLFVLFTTDVLCFTNLLELSFWGSCVMYLSLYDRKWSKAGIFKESFFILFFCYVRLLTVLESATGVKWALFASPSPLSPPFSFKLLRAYFLNVFVSILIPFPSCMSNHWDGAQINLCQSPSWQQEQSLPTPCKDSTSAVYTDVWEYWCKKRGW